MDPATFKLNYERAVSHLKFSLELCQIQREGGRHYLLEQPLTAASWKESCMAEFLAHSDDAILVTSHMCRLGMTQIGPGGAPMPVLKPTRWLTNSSQVASALNVKFLGGHEHCRLEGGSRAHRAQIYPRNSAEPSRRHSQKNLKVEIAVL